MTAFGPTSGKPVLVTSFPEFERIFGGFLPTPAASVVNQWDVPDEGGYWWKFPLTVKGFFDNGGQRLYLKRVFSNAATAAAGDLGSGLAALVVANSVASALPTLVRLDGLSGVDSSTSITFYRGDTGVAIDTQVVSSYDAALGLVAIPALGGDLLANRGDFAVIAGLNGPPPATLTFTAASIGAWAENVLSVRVRPIVAATLRILFNPALGDQAASTTLAVDGNLGDTKVTVPSNTNFTGTQRLVIGGDEYDAGGPAVANGANWDLPLALTLKQHYPAGSPVRQLRRANLPANNTLNVWGANQLYPDAIVEADNNARKDATTVNSISGNLVTFNSNLAQQYWEGEWLRLIEAEVRVRYTPNGGPLQTETFTGLRLKDDGGPDFIVTNVNAHSKLVRAIAGSALANQLTAFPAAPLLAGASVWTILSGGDDALASLTVDDFTGVGPGSPSDVRGIQALDLIDDIALVVAPGLWSRTVQSALIEQCEARKDRFAILDSGERAPAGRHQSGARHPRHQVCRALLPVGRRARPVGERRRDRPAVGPRGRHLRPRRRRARRAQGAGQRGDPRHHRRSSARRHQARAGRAQPASRHQRAALLPRPRQPGLGRARRHVGRGVEVHERAAALHLPRGVDRRRHAVGRIRAERRAAVGARSPDDRELLDVGVARAARCRARPRTRRSSSRCDRTTMTQDDIDNGRLSASIGIAPVKPAEFVIFRIQQKTLDLIADDRKEETTMALVYRDDPYAGYNFELVITGISDDGKAVKGSFAEVSGLEVDVSPIDYRNGCEDITRPQDSRSQEIQRDHVEARADRRPRALELDPAGDAGAGASGPRLPSSCSTRTDRK